MRPFSNVTSNGNSKAIRKGRIVPDGDVNLAYVKAPEPSPEANVVIVDTSRAVEENINNNTATELYVANESGRLSSLDGNLVISDQYPIITDVFAEDGTPLPFVHISRYFLFGSAGLGYGNQLVDYTLEDVKVVDAQGLEYSSYKVKVAPAKLPEGIKPAPGIGYYRLHVFVDTDSIEGLSLTYNKVELNGDFQPINRDMHHSEILNPEPFFEYRPEESEVVDPASRNRKVYSTKSISSKESLLGKPASGIDGYSAIVPKKALSDPRVYQTFRWRLNCTFKQDVTSRIVRGAVKTINCGVIVTSDDLSGDIPSRSPYVFYNLYKSRYNSGSIEFRNPNRHSHTEEDISKANYWFVNVDTDDLSQYDFLIWSPPRSNMDISKYVPKINNFTENIGGTILIDTGNWTDFGDSLGLLFSAVFHPTSGSPRSLVSTGDSPTSPGDVSTIRFTDKSHMLVDGNARLGGWSLSSEGNNNPPVDFLTYLQRLGGNVYSQYVADNYDGSVIEVQQGSNWFPVLTESRQVGYKYVSTIDIAHTASALFSAGTGQKLSDNVGPVAESTASYLSSINSLVVEGAMKLIYNMALGAIKMRSIHDAEEESYSTTWVYSTPWQASWVIDPSNGVLNAEERDRFNFLIDARDIHAEEPDATPVWKRRISSRTIEEIFNHKLEDFLADPVIANRIEGAEREYSISITNPNVNASSKLFPNDYLNVWTEAYSPRFTVPLELGPHIIREEGTTDGEKGRAIQYDAISYIRTDYPERQYRGRVIASYNETEELAKTKVVNYTATGTARATTVRYVTRTVPVYNNEQTAVLHPVPVVRLQPIGSSQEGLEDDVQPQVGRTSHRELNWSNTSNQFIHKVGSISEEGARWSRNLSYPEYGVIKPKSIRTWQSDNYEEGYSQCWPYWGVYGRLDRGVKSDLVRFFQHAHNQILHAGYIEGNLLVVDGFYGPVTKSAALHIQDHFNASYKDGIVDAETWFILGSQLLRLVSDGIELPSGAEAWLAHYKKVENLSLQRLSDGDEKTWVAKHSSVKSSPGEIKEYYLLDLGRNYVITNINLKPYIEGQASAIKISLLDAGTRKDLIGYDPSSALISEAGIEIEKDTELSIPIGPVTASSVIIGISQDLPSGRGESRFLGLSNFSVTARTEDDTISLEQQEPPVLEGALGSPMYSSGPIDQSSISWLIRGIGTQVDKSTLPVVDWSGFEPKGAPKADGVEQEDHWRRTGLVFLNPDAYPDLYNQIEPLVSSRGAATTTAVAMPSVVYDLSNVDYWNKHPDAVYEERYYEYAIRESDGWIVQRTISRYGVPVTQTIREPVYSTRTINFTTSGSTTVKTLEPKTIRVSNPRITGYHSVSNFRYNNITVNDPDVMASIDTSGRASFFTYAYESRLGTGVKEGPRLPDVSGYYSMDENGRVSPVPEVGVISKTDGIKLFCNKDGSPYGFPQLPSGVGPNEFQRHYSKLSVITEGSDPSVYFGFYDKAQKEFVTASDGSLQMSYVDYVKRGPQNIYLAAITNYEETSDTIIPSFEEDSPRVPYKWAMPLYAIAPQKGSRIALEPLPPRLGKDQMWPIVVRDGDFSRYVDIRDRRYGPLQGWLANYQGSTLRAFYSLPEARSTNYSQKFGPPNSDVLAEEPIILDDRVIQVRQAPVLTYIQPTANPGPADPRRLAAKIYRRASRTSPWYELPYSQIRDFNSSTGEIHLVDPVYSNDPGLIKVDYTTRRSGYHFKRYEDLFLNLNVHSAHARKLIGEAITIYIVPEYVKDTDGIVIPESIQDSTLRASLDTSVFDPLSPYYNPLAVQLGVVYLTVAFDVSELSILDTRRRGGGIKDNANLQEVNRIMGESWHYWDIHHGSGSSYPNSGYVVVRLPEALKDSMTQQEIEEVVSRNITAGTAFKIETLEGQEWSLST